MGSPTARASLWQSLQPSPVLMTDDGNLQLVPRHVGVDADGGPYSSTA